jgi:hypothetical protein
MEPYLHTGKQGQVKPLQLLEELKGELLYSVDNVQIKIDII